MAQYPLATPNEGKTHVKNSRLFIDEVDISGDSRQVSTVGVEYDTNDITGYSNGVHYVQLGQANHLLSGYQAVFSNTASTGSHTELKAREEYIISYCLGVGQAPEVGSHAWLSTQEQITYDVQGGSGGELIGVDFLKSLTNLDHSNPWGIVLSAGTSQSGDIDLGSCDNIIPTTNGLIANLHVTATSGVAWTFDIEESSDNNDAADVFASIGQFVLDGSAVGSEQLVVTAAGAGVERYLRVAIVRTGGAGTVTAWITVSRNLNLAT